MQAFAPRPAGTVSITVSSASQRQPLGNAGNAQSLRICNLGSATVWIDFGDVTVTTAAATGIPVPSGVVEVLQVNGATHVAAIAAGSTGSISFTPGMGI